MKRILLIACLFCTTSLMAQNFAVGVKAGVNVTNFTGGDFGTASKSALIGYHVGGYMNFKLGKVSLQPELLLSSAGAKFDASGNTNNIKLTYVSIPVMLKYRTTSGIYFEGGPQVSFKTSESLGQVTISDFAKSLDLAAGLGIGYETKSGFGFGARAMFGISKVGDFDPNSVTIDPDFKNMVIQAGLSYKLFPKK